MSAPTASTGPSRSLSSRVLGVVTDEQTYRNVAYLLSRFPLGIAYFVTFVTGITLGVALIPLVVGIPILGTVLGLAPYLAAFEASLARRFLGIEVSIDPPDPDEQPLVPYLKATMTNPATYVLVAYLLATFGIGIGLFVLVVTLVVLAVSLAVAPLTYWLPWTQYKLGTIDALGVGPIVVDTLPEALLASVVGITLGIASLHLFNGLARGLGRFLQLLLS